MNQRWRFFLVAAGVLLWVGAAGAESLGEGNAGAIPVPIAVVVKGSAPEGPFTRELSREVGERLSGAGLEAIGHQGIEPLAAVLDRSGAAVDDLTRVQLAYSAEIIVALKLTPSTAEGGAKSIAVVASPYWLTDGRKISTLTAMCESHGASSAGADARACTEKLFPTLANQIASRLDHPKVSGQHIDVVALGTPKSGDRRLLEVFRRLCRFARVSASTPTSAILHCHCDPPLPALATSLASEISPEKGWPRAEAKPLGEKVLLLQFE
jgi:hypothetical protein